MTYQQTIKDQGYELCNRTAFVHDCLVSPEFKARSLEMAGIEIDLEALANRALEYPGIWVLWDPSDDQDGFLLVGDDPEELAREACEHLEIHGMLPNPIRSEIVELIASEQGGYRDEGLDIATALLTKFIITRKVPA